MRILTLWDVIQNRYIRTTAAARPEMILLGTRCVWRVDAGDGRFTDRPNRQQSEEAATPWEGEVHGGSIVLPSGERFAVGPVAQTMINETSQSAYFLLALPEVWATHPAFASNSGSDRLTEFWQEVVLHELVHTRQLVSVAARIEAIRDLVELPENIDDDLIQTRFGSTPRFADSIEKELSLLQAAALAIDDGESMRMLHGALALASDRQREFFSGRDSAYAELESLFLALEGAAIWLSLRGQVGPYSESESVREALVGQNLSADNWVQAYGVLLYALVDRFVPRWEAVSFEGVPVSPFVMLRSLDAN